MTTPPAFAQDIHLLIFDLDGTLIDSQQDLAASVNAMLDRMNRPALPSLKIASYVGRGVPTLMRRALGEGASEEEVERAATIFLDHYRAHMLDHTVSYPGVREALEELSDCRMAVLTNKPVKFSERILAGLGMDHYFFAIRGGDSFPRKKPDPVGVLALAREAGVPLPAALMVGDSDTDVLAGRHAGVRTCGVTYGIGSETLQTTPPDFQVDNLQQLPALLRGTLELGSGRPGAEIEHSRAQARRNDS